MNQTEEKVILVFLNNICKNNAKKGVFNRVIVVPNSFLFRFDSVFSHF